MAFLETPDLPQPRFRAELLVGAASPLWSYFGAVAAGGVAFWWMTRWSRPANLEALFAAAASGASSLSEERSIPEAPVNAELASPPIADVTAVVPPAPEAAGAAAEAFPDNAPAAAEALVPPEVEPASRPRNRKASASPDEG